MAEFDLKGSIAHVTMLGETGIITKEEALQIKQGLEELLEEYKACLLYTSSMHLGTTYWTLHRHSTSLSSHCNIDV